MILRVLKCFQQFFKDIGCFVVSCCLLLFIFPSDFLKNGFSGSFYGSRVVELYEFFRVLEIFRLFLGFLWVFFRILEFFRVLGFFYGFRVLFRVFLGGFRVLIIFRFLKGFQGFLKGFRVFWVFLLFLRFFQNFRILVFFFKSFRFLFLFFSFY